MNLEKSLREQIMKKDDEKTSVQIRLFDDKSAAVAYKHLTSYELKEILKILENLTWLR